MDAKKIAVIAAIALVAVAVTARVKPLAKIVYGTAE